MKRRFSKIDGSSTSEVASDHASTLLPNVSAYLPWYLNSADRNALFDQLKSFPNGQVYMLGGEPEYPMQGDVWTKFRILNSEDREWREVTGAILSNSCDISDANTRSPFQRIVFAPRYSLSRYRDVLRDMGATPQDIENTLQAIRQQRNTRIFYYPATAEQEESMIRLDDLHTEDLEEFLQRDTKARVAALRNYGWFIFLIKLSIHFTRVQEQIQRG